VLSGKITGLCRGWIEGGGSKIKDGRPGEGGKKTKISEMGHSNKLERLDIRKRTEHSGRWHDRAAKNEKSFTNRESRYLRKRLRLKEVLGTL